MYERLGFEYQLKSEKNIDWKSRGTWWIYVFHKNRENSIFMMKKKQQG